MKRLGRVAVVLLLAGSSFAVAQVANAATAPSTPQYFFIEGNGTGSVWAYWMPPTSNGGSPIVKYTITDGAHVWTYPTDESFYEGDESITGLDPNRSYSFHITATNAAGYTSQAAYPPEPSVMPRPAVGNLALNPSFEGGLSYWQGFNGSINRLSASGAPNGTRVAKVTRTSGTFYSISDSAFASTVPTVPVALTGQRYIGLAYVKAANAGSVGKPVAAVLKERGSTGLVIRETRSAAKNLTTSWQQVWVDAGITTSGDSLGFRIEQTNAVSGNSFLVDYVRVDRASNLADGEPPTGNGPLNPNTKRSSGWELARCSDNDPYFNEPCPEEYDFPSMKALVDGKAGGTGLQPIRGFIYRYNPWDSSQPARLVAVTQPVTIKAGQNAGWATLPFATPVHLESGWYEFGLQAGGTTTVVRYYNGSYGNDKWWNADKFSDGPSKIYGAPHAAARDTIVGPYGG
jgi:hypothetical protein